MTKHKISILSGTTSVMLMIGSSASAQGLSTLFDAVTDNVTPAVSMIMILAFVGGLFFAVSAMLKMKDAKENPRDNSAGTIALNWVAAIFLLFLGGGIMMMTRTLGVDDTLVVGGQTVTYN